MLIKKSEKVYEIIEAADCWKVSAKPNTSISIEYKVSKELCQSLDELQLYIMSEDIIF